ncbi:MAG TPA: type I secretion C-terminal target domain-containing protein, partial [Gammaproteobacteria bacterium]
ALYDAGATNEVAAYASRADWIADTAVFNNTIVALSGTEVNGAGQTVDSTVNWGNAYIGVGNNLVDGKNQEILTLDFHAAPITAGTLAMSVSKGSYTWTAYDDVGSVLGTGVSTSSSLQIADIGIIDSITLKPTTSGSVFRLLDDGSEFTRLMNIDDVGPLNFTIDLVDSDGDTASTTVDVTFSNDNTLTGTAGDDVLQGFTGDDILTGGAGTDFLEGAGGNDILTGGSDIDTFVWRSGDEGTTASPATDVITDFTVGPGGDVLDLSDLLQGEESSPLTDYITVEFGDFDTDGDSETRLNVDSDGGMFFQPNQSITLDGVDLTAGGTLTDQEILDNLISDGNLKTDT